MDIDILETKCLKKSLKIGLLRDKNWPHQRSSPPSTIPKSPDATQGNQAQNEESICQRRGLNKKTYAVILARGEI
jgi:hypothetical protein